MCSPTQLILERRGEYGPYLRITFSVIADKVWIMLEHQFLNNNYSRQYMYLYQYISILLGLLYMVNS